MTRQWVPSLDWLREAAQQDGGLEVRLHLNGGLFSRKHINYYPGAGWQVYNHVDDSRLKELTDEQLGTETNIVKGIGQNALSYDTEDLQEVAHGTDAT
jgi:hypothetical protein